MENEKQLTEQESLAIIREMINRSRTNFKEQSVFYLLWGWLVVGALVVEAILFNQQSNYHWVVWPIMGIAGGIASGILGRKMGEKAGHSSPIDRIMKFVWLGFVIYLLLIIIYTSHFTGGWNTSFVLIAGLYGLGTFISGGILKFKPLIYGGVASFVLVMAAAFFPSITAGFNQAMLFLAASITCSYLIPGYMLKYS